MGNPKIIPIAMKCNQEQFDAVKGKLNNISIIDLDTDCFDNTYLINNYRNGISNASRWWLENKEHEIHETWNEEIFLKACGIDTEPIYTITKDQLLELENGFTLPKLKQWFPDVFEVKLEVGRWMKTPLGGFYCPKEKTKKGFMCYGFTPESKTWVDSLEVILSITDEDIKSTKQEVFEALKNEAVKRGFVEGAYIQSMVFSKCVKLVKGEYRSSEIDFCMEDDCLLWNGFKIFDNGKWAEIIPTVTKKEAEEKLNCKIV